jgi:hypothetical protein
MPFDTRLNLMPFKLLQYDIHLSTIEVHFPTEAIFRKLKEPRPILTALFSSHYAIIGPSEKGCAWVQGQISSPSPLHTADSCCQLEAAEFLLGQGAETDIPDKEGTMPLHMSVRHEDIPLTRLLLSRGADVHATDVDLFSPLLVAAETGSVEMLELLLGHGANLASLNTFGQSSLAIAAKEDHWIAAWFLMQAGLEHRKMPSDSTAKVVAPSACIFIKARTDCSAQRRWGAGIGHFHWRVS